MDTRTLTPSSRLHARQTYGRAAEAFDTVAWRAPTSARYDGQPAREVPETEPTLRELFEALPAWATVVGGGVIAAVMGLLLGGALHI